MITYTIKFINGGQTVCRDDRQSVRLEEMGVWITDKENGDDWIMYSWSQIAYVSSSSKEVSDNES